jgi:hypothetical protein
MVPADSPRTSRTSCAPPPSAGRFRGRRRSRRGPQAYEQAAAHGVGPGRRGRRAPRERRAGPCAERPLVRLGAVGVRVHRAVASLAHPGRGASRKSARDLPLPCPPLWTTHGPPRDRSAHGHARPLARACVRGPAARRTGRERWRGRPTCAARARRAFVGRRRGVGDTPNQRVGAGSVRGLGLGRAWRCMYRLPESKEVA